MPTHRTITFLAACVIGLACGGGPAAIDRGGPSDTSTTRARIGGTFALIRLGGQQLPADLGFLPNRDGTLSECKMLVPTGTLMLDTSLNVFAITYDVYNACTGNRLATQGAHGTFSQRADTLDFRANLGEGKSELFLGRVLDSLITAHEAHYVFKR